MTGSLVPSGRNLVSPPLLGLSQRVPPANPRAEQALLGAVLANNRALDKLEEFLRAEHFADEAHQRIWAAIVARTRVGRVADAVSLREDLANTGALDEVGGTQYLADLLASMVGVINATEYGRTVLDCWWRRQLIEAGVELVDLAFGQEPGVDAAAAMERHEARLLRIVEGLGGWQPTVPLGAAVGQAVTAAEAAAARGDGLAGPSTGLRALDELLKGLLPGVLVVLAARPSMGKTSLGLTIATRASATGKRGLFASGEMTAAQLGARVAAAAAGLSTAAVFTGRALALPDDAPPGCRGRTRPLSREEWDALMRAQRAAAHLPLEIDERPGLSVAALRARARRMKRAGGLDFVVVDYLQILRASDDARRLGRYAAVSEISADLQALAKELHVPVLALAQLNRANETREDKRPTLADLRDSGTIEQDADQVMLLHRPHYYLHRQGIPERKGNETAEDHANRMTRHLQALRESEGVAEVLVVKNKHGPTGTARLRFQDHTTWFRDEDELDFDPAWSGVPLGTTSSGETSGDFVGHCTGNARGAETPTFRPCEPPGSTLTPMSGARAPSDEEP